MGGGKKEKLRGNVSEILPGVYRIVLPIPGSRPGPLNVYLFTGNPVTLVDTGFVKTTGVLAESLSSLGYSFADIEKIVITHGHVDHYGGAALIRRRAQKPIAVLCHREDAPGVEQKPSVPDLIIKRFYRMTGMPVRYRLAMLLLRRGFKSMAAGCTVDAFLEDGDVVRLGSRRARVVATPGHSKGGICLFLEKERVLFSGDHVLGHITPNAFVMLEPDSHVPRRSSQVEFYRSLERLTALRPSMVYTGHMEPVADLAKVSASYRESFGERQRLILEILKTGKMTPYRIARKLFPHIRGRRFVLDIYLSISEVYTHLQVLEAEGKVLAERSLGRVRFRAAAPLQP